MRFVDLQIDPSAQDLEEVLSFASELGYTDVGLVLNRSPSHEMRFYLRSADKYNLNLVSRLNLFPKDPKDLLNLLKRYRLKYEIIAVTCDNLKVTKQAAKDRRVDLLNFPIGARPFFDRSTAQLASVSNATLEITLSDLILNEGIQRVMAMNKILKEIQTARNFKIPIVLSSGARDLHHLRGPSEVIALGSAIGLTRKEATDAITNSPLKRIEKNREKLNPDYIPGVKLIRSADFAGQRL